MKCVLQHLTLLLVLSVVLLTANADAAPLMAKKTPDGKWVYVPIADGFDFPVGKPDGKGYYKTRGVELTPPCHVGEDWKSDGGGNSGLGDPVYSIGLGFVSYAADSGDRHGNVVMVRHVFREPCTGKVLCCQSLYGHLDRIDVVHGQLVGRGQQVGTIGTNHGKCPAYLHAELHFNVMIHCNQPEHTPISDNYGNLTSFILHYRKLKPEHVFIKAPL